MKRLTRYVAGIVLDVDGTTANSSQACLNAAEQAFSELHVPDLISENTNELPKIVK